MARRCFETDFGETIQSEYPKGCAMGRQGFKTLPDRTRSELAALSCIAPSGYMICLNISLRGPEYFACTYPDAWQREYEKNGYMFSDPVVTWAMTRVGICRWSDIFSLRQAPLLDRALRHGLAFGGAVAILDGGVRSLLSLARSDREYEHDELARCEDLLETLTASTFSATLSIEELDTLRLAAEGLAQKEIAAELDIAEPTVKARLLRAKDKLGARNTTHAVSTAMAAKLL